MYIKSLTTEEDLYDTINKCGNIVAEEIMNHYPTEDTHAPYWSGNLHKITDCLIENAGRFALVHSSDILITIQSLFEELKNKEINQPYYTFAIREHGVDGNSLFLARSQSESDKALYRKVFFVQIIQSTNSITHEPALKIQLKEL